MFQVSEHVTYGEKSQGSPLPQTLAEGRVQTVSLSISKAAHVL